MTRVISRRAVLRGAGGVSIALPLLEAMLPSRRANGATAGRGKRFIAFFTPGGVPMDWWRPTGTEENFDLLSSVLAPLAPHKQQIIVVDGLELKVAKDGHGAEHTRGMGAFLTATAMQSGTFETQAKGVGNLAGYAAGPSLDQVLGRHLGGASKFTSIQLGIRSPSTPPDADFPAANPTTIISYEAADKPVMPAVDPQAVFKRLFGDLASSADAPALAAARARDRSILDLVGRQYVGLCKRLGKDDCNKLDEHLAKIREIETRLAAPLRQVEGCRAPTMPALFDYNTDESMPVTSKLMIDLLVMAMTCDLTPSAVLQWGDTGAVITMPSIGLTDIIHHYEHAWSETRPSLQNVWRWYAEQLAYLLDKMSAVKEGDQTLLDSAAVYWGSELGEDPASHTQTNMPFVLAGRAGGYFRAGRWVNCAGLSHTNLLVSLQNAFGIEFSTFGDPKYCSGPLANLT